MTTRVRYGRGQDSVSLMRAVSVIVTAPAIVACRNRPASAQVHDHLTDLMGSQRRPRAWACGRGVLTAAQIGAEQNSTIIFPLPIALLGAMAKK